MRSRRRQATAIACLLAVLSQSAPAAQSVDSLPDSQFVKQQESFAPDGGAPIELRFAIARGAAAQTTRVVNTTRAALSMLTEWFGPFPRPSFIVVGSNQIRPGLGAPPSVPAVQVVAPLHWIALVRDQQTEREIIRAFVNEYWRYSFASPPGSFTSSLVAYISIRAIHQQLEGSNFATPRFFGGFVPFPLRSLLLSPPITDPRPRVWRFDDPGEGPIDADVARGIGAFQTIERHVGWPAMLQALAAMRAGSAANATEAGLAEILSEIRGTDLRPFVGDCFRAGAAFDSAVDTIETRQAGNGLIESTITIARKGSGRFTLPVLVRFADGSEVGDVFDGAAPSASLVYTAKAEAVSAFVDPDVTLLLDVNRENNAMVRNAPRSKLGVRLALHWLSWLQNAMLSYTALL